MDILVGVSYGSQGRVRVLYPVCSVLKFRQIYIGLYKNA